MKIAIVGATGGTGIEMVRQSIEHGHSVTAFVRNPEPLRMFQGKINVRTGDLLNTDELAAALEGNEAVLSGFGPRVPIAKKDAHLLRDFAGALTTAMRAARLRRAIVISTAFLFKDSLLPPTHLIGKLFFPSVVSDAADMESAIQRSELDWTIVRPPQLTDSSQTNKYRQRVGHLPRFGFKISRADVADYFVRALNDDSLIRRVVGISN